jgi:peptide deformylase
VTGDVSALARDMVETMYAAPGRGLAAPQVGVAQRLFVMDASWKDGAPDPVICINPVIAEMPKDRVTGPEGCLSIPGIEAKVARAPWIVLAWTDPDGAHHSRRLDGAAAIIAQHECDHLDGVVTFDRLTPKDRTRLEASYAE